MKTKLVISLLLFALAGQLAHAQMIPFTTPGSPSPTSNVVEVLQFSVQAGPHELFAFAVTTPSAGEVMDAGIFLVSSGTATLHEHTGAFSLASATSLAAGNVQLFALANLEPQFQNSGYNNLVFAMCSSGTSAQVTPYLRQSWYIQAPTSVNSTGYWATFSRGFAAVESPWQLLPTVFFAKPWASDSNWGTDSTDVCTNGVLPNTITLSNVTPNS